MALKRIYAKQNQSVTSSTTLVDINDLVFRMKQYCNYYFKAVLFYDTTSVADFKYLFTGSAAATKVRVLRKMVGPADTAYVSLVVETAYPGAAISWGTGSGDGGIVDMEGIITNGSSESDFKLQFAQNTSDPSNTSILPGSYIEYEQVKGNLY